MLVPVFCCKKFHLFVVSLTFVSFVCATTAIDIDPNDGGYRRVVIAISSKVPQHQAVDIITSIQDTLREASKYLYEAMDRRTWLKDVTIVLPKEWNDLPSPLVLPSGSGTQNIEPIGLETFENADIRVSAPNNIFGGDSPYTHQVQGCGKPGQYIHITPDFLLQMNETKAKFGEPGRVLVHEWAHLRFGVFDEYGYVADPIYPPFYFNADDEVVSTGCSDHKVNGINRNVDTGGVCDENPRTGLPEKQCAFEVLMSDNDGVTSSIMDRQYLKNVKSFCGRSKAHNKLAPNKQNNLCQGQSIWQVIQSTEDFAKMPTKGTNLDPTKTSFRLVREKSPRYVLVVDTSSKRNDYSREMKFYTATSKAIKYYFPIGSYVGIVEFNSAEKTQIKVNVTELKNDRDRNMISQSVPDSATGERERCIYCGITKAIMALKTEVYGSNIILLTDGNIRPSELTEVKNAVKRNKLRLFVLLYPYPGIKGIDWEGAAHETNGKAFVIKELRKNKNGNAVTVMDLEAAYLTILRETVPPHMAPITVIQHVKELSRQIARSSAFHHQPMGMNDQGNLIKGSFNLDTPSSMVISIYYSKKGYVDQDKTKLIGPSKAYDINDFTIDKYISTIFFKIENAKNGTWQYEVVGRPPTQQPLIVTAVVVPNVNQETAQTRPSSVPISIKGWMNVHDQVDPSKTPVIFYVELKRGDLPVIGARVRAIVEIVSTSNEKVVQPPPFLLRDNGNGDSDVTANDGLYSGYFTNFFNISRYTVKVIAEDDGKTYINTAYQSGSSVSPIRPGLRNCCGSQVPLQRLISTGSFSREHIIGTFNVISKLAGDSFPPSRIGDLQIVEEETNLPNPGGTIITLKWTAPGDDYDYGRASEYELRYSKNREDLIEKFDYAGDRVTRDVNGVRLEPLPAGSIQRMMVAMPPVDRDVVYYIAIRAKDEIPNHRSKLSNVVQVLVKRTPKQPPPKPGYTGPPPTSNVHSRKDLNPAAAAGSEDVLSGNLTLIIAVIIGFLLFIIFISLIIYFLFRRRKEPRRGPNPVLMPSTIPTTKQDINKAHIVAQLGPPDHHDYSMSPVQSWPASTLLNHYDKVEEAKMRNQPPPIMTYENEEDVKHHDSNESLRSSMTEKDEKMRLDTTPELTSSTPSLTHSANLSLRRVTQV